MFVSPALAAEPVTYSPDFCEFTVTFPTEPYKTQRCDEAQPDKCYEQISYTQVYDLDATVNFRVICNPVGKDIKDSYSGAVMEATLKAMTKDEVVQTFETSFREEKDYKQAGLVGEGQMGRTPTVYIAQLWIGDHSAFSVEAELIGEAHEQADKLYSDVLKSIGYKGEDGKIAPPVANPPESGEKEGKSR
ncbi:MAG: hypothetical protein K9G62_01220 [Alphaproteobacteria bacterium]|nr:hypothetical protein [Alphaproteobacteria bacterium]